MDFINNMKIKLFLFFIKAKLYILSKSKFSNILCF